MRPAFRLLSLLAIAATTAASARAQNVRVLQRTSDPRIDSIVDRIYKGNVDEVRRIVTEWSEREGQLVTAMRTTPVDGNVTIRRRLDEDVMRSTREAFAMMRAIQERCAMERGPVPEGYIGVSLDTRFDVVDGRPQPGGVIVSSVEPDGPSQRAGLQSNDRLIAIAGRDARQRIPEIVDLLVPGRVIAMRVERDGTPRDVTITVGPRPKGFAESCGEFDQLLMPLRAGAFGGIARPRTADPRGGARMQVEVGPILERMREASPDEIQVFVFNPGGPSEIYFAGAKFRTLDDDWREILGAKQGVMVFDVAAGSLAARAGLKGGDVVTSVGSEPASDPMVFLRLLDIGARREATLSVLREKKPRTVTLTWGTP
jgi:C-terminal processing protease CtpA/Prc